MTSSRHHSSHAGPGFTRGPRISDLMTRDHDRFVESSLAAERSGDAETALEYHRGVPMFAKGAHTVMLTQLAGLSEEMTPWMWARWTAYQCTRTDDTRHRSGEILRAALEYTVQMFYADRIEEAHAAGADPLQLVAHMLGESWLFHQLCTFEMGGLQEFLDILATGRLVQEAALAPSWVGALMGGYRLARADAGSLTVHDLRADQEVALLDLGAVAHADAGGWLLGRLVPSGTTPALMFESRPIAVDEQTARAAAGDPSPRGWITALKEGIDDGRVDRSRLESEDRELVTDVPSLSLVEVGTPPAALASTMSQLRRGRDEVGRAALRILSQVADGRFGPDERAAYVAAAVLNPHAHATVRGRLATVSRPERWTHWAELVPDPARARLLRLAAPAAAA